MLKLVSVLVLILTIGSGNAWGISVSDLSTTAATSLTDGATYVVATAYNGTYLTTGVSSGWGTANTTITNAAVFTAHGSESGFYLTCSAGTLVPATSKTFSAYNSGTSNNLSLSASGEIQNLSNTSWKLRLNTNFRWYSTATGLAVYLFEINSSSPSLSVSGDATSLAMGDAKVNGSGVSNSTLSFSGSNLTANATLSISGTNAAMFSVSPTSVSKGSGTITNQTITVTYTPTSAGSHTATLTISSTGATSKTITLTGTGKYEVIWKNNGSDYTTTLVASGSRPTFPDAPTSCDGTSTTFYGWTSSPWSGKIDDISAKTIHTSNSTMSTISANGTVYHAVFCKGSGGSVTITNKMFTDALSGSYATVNITSGDYTFEVNACEQDSKCQMRDNATLSYIAIPTLPGVISRITATTVANASGGSYSSVLHFKHTKSRGNADTNNITKLDCSSSAITSLDWDVSGSNSTYKAGYLLTSGGLRLSDLTIYYGGSGTNYLTNCCSDPGLAYGTASVTKTYGASAFTNTLTNSHSVAVTYALSSVSPAGCVSINASTGQVTINGAGSATVTASSVAQTVAAVSYCADEASYTLTVNKANISPTLTYSPNSVAVGENSATPSVGGNSGSGTVTYAITSASPAGCATINTSTGVVTGVAVGSVTVTATVGETANYNGNTATATVTIVAASNFLNGETVFIQADSKDYSAWKDDACVLAWFNNSGSGGSAVETFWLFDATDTDAGKKLFAAVVPASGTLNQVQLQRKSSDCSSWWNSNGDLTKASSGGVNTFRSYGSADNNIAWNGSSTTLSLYGSQNSWGSSLATFSDQGAGVWTASFDNYTPDATSKDYKIKTSYNNGWIGNTGSNNNATLSGMIVGSTYNVTATLDVTDHSLVMSKTFVNGTVHFDLQGHGSAISDLTNVAAGSKISAPSPAPTAAGYRFVGWYKEPACTNAWNFGSDVVNETMTLYAKWVQTFTVTYNGNGGSGTITDSSSPYDTGSTVTVKNSTGFTAPTGKEFDHWNTAANNSGASYNPSETFTISANTTLYAQWRDINYTVTMAQSPAAGAELTGGTTTAHYNGTINISTTVPDGYRFNGWTASPSVTFASASSTSTSFTMPANNVTVTANFVQTHTVSWKSNGADYVSPVTYDHGTALVLPVGTPSAPAGCSSKVFVGWTSDPEITSETSTVPSFISAGGAVNADVTYRAVFADEGAGGTKWVRKEVTSGFSLSDVSEGTWALVSSAGYAFNGTITSGHGQKTSTYVTFVNNEVAALPTGTCELTFTKVMDGGNIVGYTIYSATRNQYLYATKAASGGLAWQDSETSYWTVTSNNWVYEWNTAYMRVYDNTFRTYASSSNSSLWLAKKTSDVSYDNYITVCSSCTTPSSLAMSAITSTGGKVSWSGVSLSPTEGYKVAWNTSNSVPSPLTISNSADVDADKSEYTISGLTPATQYYVFVKSKCNDTWSSSTNFYTNAKITYAAGTGASGSMDPKEVTYNAASTTVDACTFTAPSGKVFNGWVSNVAVTVNGGGSPTTAVPAGATINNLTAAITLTAQWRDLAVYHVTFSADNGTVAGGSSQDVLEGGTLTFPNVTSTTCGTFSGWVEAAYDNTAAPSGATYHAVGDELAADPSMDGKTYYAVYRVATGAPTNINDELTAAKIGVTSYEDWSGITDASAAIYAGNSAKNTTYSNSIQIRSSNSSGIVTTTSGGLAKKVTFDWVSGNTAGRVVDIYGKNSAYSSAADLYSGSSATQGTKIGSITYNSTTELTISTDYEYIGIRSNSGAAYIGTITIQWYGSPMKYQTSPACSPVINMTSSFSSFTYVYGSGPSASQSFTVSGANLGANLVVTAPANYEVCKTSDGTYTNSVSYTPSDGTVTDQTVYIRLAGGLNVGTYNYAAASGVSAASTGATTRTAALNGSVTKAAGAIAFTDFNAVDHYEAEMPKGGTSLDVTLTVSVTGDGAVSYSRTPTAGSSAVPATTPTTTLHVTTVGTWTVTANLAAGTNYTSASTNCQVVVYYADRFYDNLHGNSTIVKRNDSGEDHYTIPSLSDESRQTSGTCSQTHYHFMGWVPEAALGSLTDDASYTAVMITSGTQAASGTNFYAVWAEE